MNIIIDTQILIWFITDNHRLKKKSKLLIESNSNQIYVSFATLWEIVIKKSIGKLDFKFTIKELKKDIELHDLVFLYFDIICLDVLQTLNCHHKDHFDRMIISQPIY